LKTFNLSDKNSATKLFWGLMGLMGSFAVLYTVYALVRFRGRDWLIAAICMAIAATISQYQIRLPKTKGYLSGRELAIFFAAIWLGPGGAVLMALVGAVGNFRVGIKNPVRWSIDIFTISWASLLASQVLYFVMNGAQGFTGEVIGNNPTNGLLLLGAMIVAGILHYTAYTGSHTLFLKLDGGHAVMNLWKDSALFGMTVGVACIFLVFGFHLLVVYFGLALGFLVLPAVIGAHLAVRFHKKMLDQKTRELREAGRIHLATVETLATAIDARDQVGRGHCSRAQIYAIGVGKIMNLPPGDIEALSTGTLLHDIGKLAVPDHILNKPGRLTPAEMEKIKIHASVGASILAKIDFSYPVVPTVKHHHERWDGAGYPDGLAKEKIPITARILAIADAYDTLRGARPYRPAISREDARQFIKSGAGTQFDPRIVDIFLRNLRGFEAEVEKRGLSYSTEPGNSPTPGLEQAFESESSYVEQIKNANREVFTLYELARVFGSSLSLRETLELFVDKITELVPLDTCVVYLLDDAETVAMAQYAHGLHSEALKNRKVQVGQGATGYTLKKRLPVYDINPGLDFSFYQMEFVQEFKAMASLPLIAKEKLIGAVSLYSCELETYEDEHMRLLETISRIASDAISTALRHAETETRAMTDPMTDLPNARNLQIQFDKEIGRAQRNGSTFQILMLDLDGFKMVNDTFGHKVGDAMLKGIADVMKEQLRDYDFLARYAGDEFVAIVPDMDRQAVHELCQRMEKSVRAFSVGVGHGKAARVGVSIGAASYPNNGDTLDSILIAADKAMYAVKAHRKARIRRIRAEKLAAHKRKEELLKQKHAPVPVREIEVEHAAEPLKINTIEHVEDALVVELDESHVVPTDGAK
jgi:diguanylate cyclase (GGDEF)-like protein/putative nucleotidyltransferase with HDIG domain